METQAERKSETLPKSPTALSSKIDQLWVRFLPEIRERVAVLEAAATAVCNRTLTPELHCRANAAAHKLAGTLGAFGLARDTDLAREVDMLFSLDTAPDAAQGQRIATVISEIRSDIEARMPNQAPNRE